MAGKPTYEELLERIKRLEKTERALTRTRRALAAAEAKASAFMAGMPFPLCIKDERGRIVDCGAAFESHPVLGGWVGGGINDRLAPDQAERMAAHDRRTLSEGLADFTETFVAPDGDSCTFRIVQFPVTVSSRKTLIAMMAMAPDAGAGAVFEETAAAGTLSSTGRRERAVEAMLESAPEAPLEGKESDLRDLNTALQVILKKRDEDKRRFEERILFNIKEMVLPYMEKIREAGLSELQETLAGILEENLKEIISPFSPKLASRYYGLTNMELKVASLVRQGKTNKEISNIFKLSKRTIESHRDSIRKKIGINKKKKNLRTYLLSMD